MTKNDIFTWSESVAVEVYGYVEGMVFKDITDIYNRVCECVKDMGILVAMSGHVDALELEFAFDVNGNSVNVILIFINNESSDSAIIVKRVVTSKAVLTL